MNQVREQTETCCKLLPCWFHVVISVASATGSGIRAKTDLEERCSLRLDEPAEPLYPRTYHSDKDRQRLNAEAMFSIGRPLEQTDKATDTLRKNRHVFRFDSRANSILRDIVRLAYQTCY